VAGHTYGSPSDTLPGLHPPFVDDFGFIKSMANLQFGFLTGDIVYRSADAYWDRVDSQIAELGVPVYFSVGNHEAGNLNLYRKRYGITYQKFEFAGDLFIILNPGLAGWNITNDQLAFLKTYVQSPTQYKHVFVFFHQVLWWAPDEKYPDLRINSSDGRGPQINFWTEIEPLFRTLDCPVYLFAGDVGATPDKTSFFYDHYSNIHLIASGMGNSIQDNYVAVNVDKDGTVAISIRWIQLGKTQAIENLN
jgi:hypothetical protein